MRDFRLGADANGYRGGPSYWGKHIRNRRVFESQRARLSMEAGPDAIRPDAGIPACSPNGAAEDPPRTGRPVLQ